ncbi:hypothetical protein B7939_01255 [Eggerthia catenaformis]|nr:hypothetical protein B7939_01255 [Eggerthia catenaformis]
MTVEELKVLISADTKGASDGLNKAKSQISSFKNHVDSQMAGVKKSIGGVKNMILGLGVISLVKSQVFGALDGAIKRADTLGNYTNVMSNLGISAVKSQQSINKLSTKLVGLPTTLDSATSAVQRFTSSNGDVNRSTDMFLALNNAILAGGASSDIQKSALEQLSQSYSKGKPDMMEWRTAMMAMPAQMKQVALAMGYVDASQLGEALRSGKVSMDDFMNTIMRLNTEGANGFKSFEEQAKNSTGGIATSIANMKTAITRGIAEVINTIGRSNIAGFFQGIAKAINAVIPYVVAFVKVLMVAFSYLSALFGGKGKASSGAKSVGKSIGGASSNAKSLGSNLGGASSNANKLSNASGKTGKGLKSATGHAKKLKKELQGALAGFDSLNILSSGSASDGGSSPGSGGGGGAGVGDIGGAPSVGALDLDTSGITAPMQEVDKQLEAIKEKVKDFFRPLKESWETHGAPLIESAQYAFKGIKDLIISIGKSFGRIWQNGTGKRTLDLIFEIWTNIFNIIGNITGGIAKAWNTAGQGDSIIQHVWNIFNSILSIINDILGVVEKVTANIDWSVVLGGVDAILGVIDGLMQGIADNLGVIGTVLASLGIAALVETLMTGVPLFTAIGEAVGGLAGVLPAISGFIAGFVSAINPVTVAIAIVAGTVIDLWNTSEKFREAAVNIIKQIGDILKQIFDNFIKPVFDTVVDIIGDFITDTLTPLWNNWKKIFENIAIAISDFLNAAKPVFDTIITILGPIFKTALEALRIAFKAVFTVIGALINVFGGVINTVFQAVRVVLSGIGSWLKNTFGVTWSGVFKGIQGVVKAFYSYLSPIIGSIKTVFNGLITFISGVFSGNWRKAWNGVKSIFSGIVSGLANIFKSPINFIIDGINTFLSGINKVKIPSWVPVVGGKGFNVPKIPRLATGGVIGKSTLANIGEAGTEAILPLERNTRGLDLIASKLIEHMPGATGQPVTVNLVVDGKVFTSVVVDEVKKQEAITGKPVFGY